VAVRATERRRGIGREDIEKALRTDNGRGRVERDIRSDGGHVDRQTPVPVDDGKGVPRRRVRQSRFGRRVDEKVAVRRHRKWPVCHDGRADQVLHVPDVGR